MKTLQQVIAEADRQSRPSGISIFPTWSHSKRCTRLLGKLTCLSKRSRSIAETGAARK